VNVAGEHDSNALDRALAQAAEEHRLDPAYVAIARPNVRDPEAPRPQCCGGGCEPCAEQLNRVIERALELLGKGHEVQD
jgi:hypothetical protein